jgi:Zn-dependent protease with chaperone function
MITTQGFWYDGKTSERRDITIACNNGGTITISGTGVDTTAELSLLKIDPRLGAALRMIHLPDGSAAETADHDFLDELQRRQGKGGFFRAVHSWETSLFKAFCALALMLLTCFIFIRYAVPFLATKAALALPIATEEFLGRETLQILDKIILKPTELSENRRKELTSLFAAMTTGQKEQRTWQLEFRSGEKIGANALALPSGIIIITDRLVELAKNDHQIAAVLAHEISHVKRRHAIRHLMQNSATALLVATVTGDITSFSSLSATLPTVLIDAKYSRNFEQEADDDAVAYLKEKNIPPQVYADILTMLGNDHKKDQKESSRFGNLFSDHPQIEDRVKRVLSGKASSTSGSAIKN